MSSKYPNRNVINRQSPKSEPFFNKAYKEMNPRAMRKDGLDVSAVKTVSGEKGYCLMDLSDNRSHDKKVHRGQDFISETELKKHISKK